MTVSAKSVMQLVFGAFLISFSAVFVKAAGIDTDLAAFYRMLFGLVPLAFFFAYTVHREKIRFTPYSVVLPVIAGFLFTGDLFFWHKSINYIGPGMATLLANFQVFTIALAAFLFMKEKLTLNFIISVPFALAGVYLLTSGGRVNISSVFYTGVVYGLITSVFYAFYIIVVRKCKIRYPEYNSFVVMFIVTLTSCLLFGSFLFYKGTAFTSVTAGSLFLMVLYGLFSQFLGWISISHALPHVRVSLAGLLILIQPVMSYVWDVLIFHKAMNAVEGAGVLIALTAIYAGSLTKK